MNRLIISALVCLTLTACQREDGSTAPAVDVVPAATHTAPKAPLQIAAVSSPMLQVEPATLPACDQAAEVTVRYDATSLPEVTAIELWVGQGSDTKLFAAGGTRGEAKTGPWTRPGVQFALKQAGTSTVLANAVVGGPDCASDFKASAH